MEAHIEQFATEIAVLKAQINHLQTERIAAVNLLETQIVALREGFATQLAALKEAMASAIAASEKSLVAAQIASARASDRYDETTEKRFAGVNEFRAALSDQQKTLASRDEVGFKFLAVEKRFDEMLLWQRTIDLKFSEYLRQTVFSETLSQWTEWRRTVDAALVSAASKSGVLWAILAMAVAAGGLFIAVFNAFARGIVH